MNNIFTKWGTYMVLIIVVGSIVVAVAAGGKSVSTWLSDNYLPKKIMILEKYPVRILMYGQYSDSINESLSVKKKNHLVDIINALDKVKHEPGQFQYQIDVNFGSNFNSKQIRSTERAIYKSKGTKNDK